MVAGPETTIIDDVTACEVASDVGKGTEMTPIDGRVVDCGEGSSRRGARVGRGATIGEAEGR